MPRPITPLNERTVGPGYSYYSPSIAKVVQTWIDAMIVDRKSRVLNSLAFRKSVGTLEKMLNRGCQYLIDKHPEGSTKYQEWRDSVMISKDYLNNCIRIGWKTPDVNLIEVGADVDSSSFKPSSSKLDIQTTSAAQNIEWQDAVDNFIETSSTGDVLELSGLKLSDEDVTNAKASCVGLSCIEVIEISSIIIKIKHL